MAKIFPLLLVLGMIAGTVARWRIMSTRPPREWPRSKPRSSKVKFFHEKFMKPQGPRYEQDSYGSEEATTRRTVYGRPPRAARPSYDRRGRGEGALPRPGIGGPAYGSLPSYDESGEDFQPRPSYGASRTVAYDTPRGPHRRRAPPRSRAQVRSFKEPRYPPRTPNGGVYMG